MSLASHSAVMRHLKDYVDLSKPGITLFCVLMAWGGMILAPANLNGSAVLFTLLGTALSVGSANTLNMYFERESDKQMRRTRLRPLPAGRMSPINALLFGLALGVISTVVLYRFVNPLTAGLSLFALISYVWVYTPLKKVTPAALVVGTIPGAIPPLMGVTALTGEINKIGLILFFILLLWQIPHFLAISLFNKDDYKRAGIRTVPLVLGDDIAKVQATGYSFALLITSLLLVPLGVAGMLYLAFALVLGIWFVYVSLKGFKTSSTPIWARQFFFVTLIYLPGLTLGLMLDKLV